MTGRWSTVVATFVTATALATSAQAGQIISFEGLSNTGASYSGELTVISSTGDTQAVIQIELTNTTPASITPGGALTSFGFDLPDGSTVTSIDSFTASGTGDDSEWEAVINFDQGGLSFDIGAATGSNPLGGTVADGIQQGDTATFTFAFTGTGLEDLQQSDFFESDFIARFQGVGPLDRSDRVPGAIVPEPASLGTAGLGVLMGLGYAWRRRKRAAA